jgi:hypothetical protein
MHRNKRRARVAMIYSMTSIGATDEWEREGDAERAERRLSPFLRFELLDECREVAGQRRPGSVVLGPATSSHSWAARPLLMQIARQGQSLAKSSVVRHSKIGLPMTLWVKLVRSTGPLCRTPKLRSAAARWRNALRLLRPTTRWSPDAFSRNPSGSSVHPRITLTRSR